MVEEKKFKENCHKEIYPKKKKKETYPKYHESSLSWTVRQTDRHIHVCWQVNYTLKEPSSL